MINKQLITRRFSRAIESYNREATAQKQIAGRLNDMLAHYLPARPRHVLEIGSGTGFLTRPLLRTFHPEKLILNDICQCFSTTHDIRRFCIDNIFLNAVRNSLLCSFCKWLLSVKYRTAKI